MKFETTQSFKRDYKKLGDDEKQAFRQAVRQFSRACDRHQAGKTASSWPGSLRVKAVQGAPGIWEMTWSFSGPDGRATWEWCTIDEAGKKLPAVRWRRIGNHAIFKNP